MFLLRGTDWIFISDSHYCPNLREGQTGEAWDPIHKFGSPEWKLLPLVFERVGIDIKGMYRAGLNQYFHTAEYSWAM